MRKEAGEVGVCFGKREEGGGWGGGGVGGGGLGGFAGLMDAADLGGGWGGWGAGDGGTSADD